LDIFLTNFFNYFISLLRVFSRRDSSRGTGKAKRESGAERAKGTSGVGKIGTYGGTYGGCTAYGIGASGGA